MSSVALEARPGLWARLPVWLRAIVSGLSIGLVAANIWPVFLIKLGMPFAALAEAAFLAAYVWWASGRGWPQATSAARRSAFRTGPLSRAQWIWGLVAALSIAASVHASLVVLFRIVPFPAAEFHRDYAFPIASLGLKWAAIVLAAASAGICEETGFRGYMQRPLEGRYGAVVAILVSSFFFGLLHLSKSWDIGGMIPLVFFAGALYGLLAWASNSLIPGMIGHTVMDIGMFSYWWTGIAGTFSARTIAETGIDEPFIVACAVLGFVLLTALTAIVRLRVLRAD
jgi:membrane protease YdiL (CAAX protease family)